MTITKIKKEIFKILTKMNENHTLYGKCLVNRPYKEIINDICKLFKEERP
jgi:hypothetical protein